LTASAPIHDDENGRRRAATLPMKFWITLFLAAPYLLPQPAAKPDPLGRDNPRSSVTSFLEACQNRDYVTAAQYLDLSSVPQSLRGQRGPDLARQLDAVLNADARFSVFRLSRDPQGGLSDNSGAARIHIASAMEGAKPVTVDLARVAPSPGAAPVWLFAAETVFDAPRMSTSSAASGIARRLPPFLSTVQIAETPLWKWIALLLGALVLFAVSRQFDRLTTAVVRAAAGKLRLGSHVAWVEAMLAPVRVFICLLLFRVGLEAIGPSAIARLYVGRLAGALLVWSIAWCFTRLAGLIFARAEGRMDENRRFASRSILHLGRRSINTAIAILAILLVLSNWGYNTATLVAGLGVGGIAIALAAQQTISNLFGGVSVIADHPIRVGEYGKFGDLLGTLEDIGLRSTRIRTLSRTIVSVPNSTLAGYNLENFASRDKILFNPTLSIKRGAPEEQIRMAVETIAKLLADHKELELTATPVRIVGIAGGGLNIEIFCYVLTQDINRFYTVQGDLFLAIDRTLSSAKVELV
jgi:MscS family membrane protein